MASTTDVVMAAPDSAAPGGDSKQVKRPRQAFAIFKQLHQETINKTLVENGGYTAKQFRAVVDQAWRHLTEEQRLAYDELARREKERISSEAAMAQRGLAVRKLQRKKKAAPPKPKRPAAAYFRFIQENKARAVEVAEKADRHTDCIAISKSLAAEWKSFTEEQKAPYVERAKVDYEKYMEEMREWREASGMPTPKPRKGKE